MHAFAAPLWRHAGALVAPFEPEGLGVLAPPAVQQALQVEEMCRLTFGPSQLPSARRVGIEGDWLNRFGRLLGDQGRDRLAGRVADPSGCGSIVRDEGGALAEIVEEADATAEQRAISEINSGCYAFDGDLLADAVKRVATSNAQGQEYLTDVVAMRDMLDTLATKLDGTSAAATVYRRKRAVLFNMLSYAVERELLPDNPMTKVKRTAPKVCEEVDPRVVANPAQVRRLLTAVTYVGQRNRDRGAHLSAFFAVGYYAAARPAEGLALREQDCTLPAQGWGELALGESRPAAGKRWTNSGQVHDRRGLKHRGAKDVRIVPIPPVLVHILREHLATYSTGPDGRLFRSPNGGVVGSSTYYRVWAQARTYALTPAQVASPLASRPYDLRHAAVSLWLNRGVPAPEVAQRAGHSVDVLLKVYAKCIEGDRVKVNKVAEDAFAE